MKASGTQGHGNKSLDCPRATELAEKIDELAARLDRSRGWIVEQALTAWIDKEEERERLTREALADVDACKLIGQEAVEAWADGLDIESPLPPPRP